MANLDSSDETDWAAVKRNGILAVLLVATGVGYAVWKNQSAPPRPEHSRPKKQATTSSRPATPKDKVSIRSTTQLEIPATSITGDSVRHHVITWLEHAWQAGGLTDPVPAHLTKESWQPFVKAAIQFEAGGPDAPARSWLRDQALTLAPVAGEHPVSAYVVGRILMGHEAAADLLDKGAQGLRDKPGMETLAFHAAAILALSSTRRDDEKVIKERVTQGLAALRKALDAEAGYSKQHDRRCAFLLHEQVSGFFQGTHEEFWNEVSKTEKVKPWVKKWIEALHCLQTGWDARGGGYSNTVSNDGQAIFEHESEKARRLLEQAWSMKPEDPAPAVSLIYSALSLERANDPEGQMRRWFDETLKLQMDVPEASQHLLWGLRPRWYGSHKKMENIGLACLETGRFDSALPWVLL